VKLWGSFLLAVLMLLQSVAAVASGFCAHEQGEAAKHIGHHEHQHVTATSAQADQAGAGGDAHADCGSCQLGHASAHVGGQTSRVSLTPPKTLPALDLQRPSSWVAPPLERPNWAS